MELLDQIIIIRLVLIGLDNIYTKFKENRRRADRLFETIGPCEVRHHTTTLKNVLAMDIKYINQDHKNKAMELQEFINWQERTEPISSDSEEEPKAGEQEALPVERPSEINAYSATINNNRTFR